MEATIGCRATLAGAFLGIGDQTGFEEWSEAAEREDVAAWMRDTASMQFAQLRELLVPSPLEMIRAAADR